MKTEIIVETTSKGIGSQNESTQWMVSDINHNKVEDALSILKKIIESLHLSIIPCRKNEKIPSIAKWQENGTSNIDKAKIWFDLSRYNYGILGGTQYAGKYLTIIDVDNKNGKNGSSSWLELTADIDPAEVDTFIVETPSGGYHYYFYTDKKHRNSVDIMEGIDVRGDGGYVVGPGSSIDGKYYTVYNDKPILPLPKSLYMLLDKKGSTPYFADNKEKVLEVNQNTSKITEGKRNDSIFKFANNLRRDGSSLEAALGITLEYNTRICNPPLDINEVERTVRSAYRYLNQAEPGNFDDELRMKTRCFFTIEECMTFFDSMYYKVMDGCKTVIKQTKGDTSNSYLKRDFFDLFSNKTVILDSKEKAAANYWFDHTNRVYSNSIFDPNPNYKPRKDILNLWKGYNFKPQDTGNSYSFLKFIKDVICSGNESIFDYLLDVMARIIQEPQSKTGANIAIALRGTQGIGKSFFVENFGKLFGESYILIDSVEKITGNFNGFLQNKIVVFGDEALWGGDKASRNILKDLITSSELTIEKKFKDSYVVKNYLRFFFATNSDWAAPIEKGNRRYLVLDVSDQHLKDREYFSAIKNDLDNGGYEDLLHTLMIRDYHDRDFENTLPVTQATIDNMICGFTPIEEWIFNILQDDGSLYMHPSISFEEKNGLAELYGIYESYIKENNGYKESRSRFSILFRRILPSVIIKREQNNGIREKYYIIPSIAQCREDFEKYIGISLNWDNL